VLKRKSPWARWVARWRWQAKQQPRYRTALLAAVEFTIDDDPLKVGFQTGLPLLTNFRTPLSKSDWRTTLRYVSDVGIQTASRHWLPAYRSIYKKSLTPPESAEKIRRSWLPRWEAVHAWDPNSEESLIRGQLLRLHNFMKEYQVALTVLYLPEHPLNRERYNMDFYRRYKALVTEELPDARILDLWDLLPSEHFYDNIHATFLGAATITTVIVEALEEQAEGDNESLSISFDTGAPTRLGQVGGHDSPAFSSQGDRVSSALVPSLPSGRQSLGTAH